MSSVSQMLHWVPRTLLDTKWDTRMKCSTLTDMILLVAKRYEEQLGFEIDPEFALHKLYEEIGEVAEAWLIRRGTCRPEKRCSTQQADEQLGDELADIVGMAVVFADRAGIDLQEALQRKWLSKV